MRKKENGRRKLERGNGGRKVELEKREKEKLKGRNWRKEGICTGGREETQGPEGGLRWRVGRPEREIVKEPERMEEEKKHTTKISYQSVPLLRGPISSPYRISFYERFLIRFFAYLATGTE